MATPTVTDPRERYDDLLAFEESVGLDAEEFAETRRTEAVESGWVVTAFVLDGRGRFLMLDHGDYGAWVTPGGVVDTGETLREAVVRETREEAGIEVTPVRPHAVSEVRFHHGGETAGFRIVSFSARAETTDVGDDLGEGDESIAGADWFETLPEDTFERERTADVLDHVRACDVGSDPETGASGPAR